jgi:hypothetical protein
MRLLVIDLERLITFGQLIFWYALANVNQIRKHDALANFRQNYAVFFFHSTTPYQFANQACFHYHMRCNLEGQLPLEQVTTSVLEG